MTGLLVCENPECHRQYDELKERKLKLAKKSKLALIEIYPKDIFPLNKNKFLPLEFLSR